MTPRRMLSAVALTALAAVAALPAHAGVYVYNAILDARQEVPANASTGKGAGRFVIDTDANTVTYRITYAGLTGAPTAGHIHGNATSFPGSNAGVVHGFASLTNAISGTWTYSEAQEPMILAGTCYANIHTGANPGGEIRGQIMPFNAQLDNTQENPATASTGTGPADSAILPPAKAPTSVANVPPTEAIEFATRRSAVGTSRGTTALAVERKKRFAESTKSAPTKNGTANRSGSARTSHTAAARSHGARSRILQRDHRSMKTPAKGHRAWTGHKSDAQRNGWAAPSRISAPSISTRITAFSGLNYRPAINMRSCCSKVR